MIGIKFYADIDPISENCMYRPAIAYTKTKKPYSYLYKGSEAIEYQSKLKDKFLLCNNLKELNLVEYPKEIQGIISFYVLGMPIKDFNKKDVTNTVKAIEDVLFSRKKENTILPYDDCRVLISSAMKEVCPADTGFVYAESWILLSGDNKQECFSYLSSNLEERKSKLLEISKNV